jgi:hypothetical protein
MRFNISYVEFRLVTTSCLRLRAGSPNCCCIALSELLACGLCLKNSTTVFILILRSLILWRPYCTTRLRVWAKHGACFHSVRRTAATTSAALSLTTATTLVSMLHSRVIRFSSWAKFMAVCFSSYLSSQEAKILAPYHCWYSVL